MEATSPSVVENISNKIVGSDRMMAALAFTIHMREIKQEEHGVPDCVWQLLSMCIQVREEGIDRHQSARNLVAFNMVAEM